MKMQKALNNVMKFAYEQNSRCTNGHGRCLLRNSDGKKCFIGNFIPDEIYNAEMEIENLCSLIDNYPALKEAFKNLAQVHGLKIEVFNEAN